MSKKVVDLTLFPAAFYIEGNINTELIKEIFALSTHASGLSKKLVKLIQREIPRNHEERLALIAKKLPDPGFRAKWYELVESKKSWKIGWRQFYQMVNLWVLSKTTDQGLPDYSSIDVERRQILFVKGTDSAFYIHPSSIPVILEDAYNSEVNPRATALYLWSYSEAAVWREYEPAKFDADYVESLMYDVTEVAEYSSQVHDFFQGLPLLKDASEVGDTQAVVKGYKKQNEDDVEDKFGFLYVPQLREELSNVEDGWNSLQSIIGNVISKAMSLQKTSISPKLITYLEDSVKDISERWKLVQASVNKYCDLFQEYIGDIGKRTIGHERLVATTPLPDKDNIDTWLTLQADNLEIFSECVDALIAYCKLVENLNSFGLEVEWEGPFEDLSSLISWLKLSIDKERKQCLEVAGVEKFKKYCATESLKIEWKPLDDIAINDWVTLCSPLQKNIVDPHLIGFVLRKVIDFNKDKYRLIVDSALTGFESDPEYACKVVSMLSSSQVDWLWESYLRLRPIISMCMLNSWFISSTNKNPSAVEVWYQKPLKDTSVSSDDSNVHIDSSVCNFLYELKELVTKQSNFNGSSVQQIIASNVNGLKFSTDHVNQLYTHVSQQVLISPNYRGSYGRLAKLAFEELLCPLHKAISSRNIKEVRLKYEELQEKFDFGSWYVGHTTGFDKRYISSQHKKKIQQYIDERFNCLEEWLNAESDAAGLRSAKYISFKNSVFSLLDKYEAKNIKAHSDYLSSIGWWVNRLRDKVVPPVLTAGNPSDPSGFSEIPIKLIDECELPWRCIEDIGKGRVPSWNSFIADTLSSWSCPDYEAYVLQYWQQHDQVGSLRCYQIHAKGRDHDIEGDLLQWIDEKEDELKRSLSFDIKEVESKLDAFHSDIKLLYLEELEDIKECFNSVNWYQVKERIDQLKSGVNIELENYGNEEKRQNLIKDIEILGGDADNECTLTQLEMHLNTLMESAVDRTVHINVLRNVMKLPELPTKIIEEVEGATKLLGQPQNIPDCKRAQLLKYILETVFTPLENLLEKPNILLPEYKELLLRLLSAIAQLLSNAEWVKEDDSRTEIILIKLSDRLANEHCIDNVQSANQILEWFLSESANTLGHTIDIGWEGDPGAYEAGINDLKISNNAADQIASIDKAKGIIIDSLSRIYSNMSEVISVEDCDDNNIEDELDNLNWEKAAKICMAKTHYLEKQDYNDSLLLWSGLSLSHCLDGKDRDEVIEAFLYLVDHLDIGKTFKYLYKKNSLSGKSVLGSLAASWLFKRDLNKAGSWHLNEEQLGVSAIHLARVLGDSRNDTASKISSSVLDSLWDFSSGESAWGADFRASLLSICTRGVISGALVYLLKNIKMQESRAVLFTGLIERATDVPGWERLSNFLDAERNKLRSKPFSLFADQLLKLSKPRDEMPATIDVVGPVEKGQSKNLWVAVVEIVPSVMDPPQEVVLILPKDSPVHFGEGKTTMKRIDGPFLDVRQIRLMLNMKDAVRGEIPVEIICRVKTLQDVQIEYMQTWIVDTGDADDNFVPPTPEFVDQCFDSFPHRPMRGKDFVSRDQDEKTIEDRLFNSPRAGSLWITSPRRSGKTSMLYKILDSFSYIEGRDDIVLYFTLSSHFESEKQFNTWFWRRVHKGPENRELHNHIANLREIGASLDADDDVDIFISELAHKLLDQLPDGARVYFVIDEIDRFAEMYLDGGVKREKSLSIMWQLRHLISRESSIGIVFAGSHAARRFFIADSQAPFYNSIAAIDLVPFNVDTQLNEERSRDIVQPKRLVTTFTVSKETLKHLLRITAGIPYYMKLLAGSTFACANHARIFSADVNKGVTKMLEKETGIKAIDMLENPGEDELRTLYAESNDEMALIKGVLLAVANIRSPISERPVNVGEIWGERSPLVVRVGLSRSEIEPALTSARDLGFLKTTSSSEYQVEFSIPLLGESMRKRFNTLWADIEQYLENIGNN